jgi:hypothetical protein
MYGDLDDLRREVSEELALAESSRSEETMLDPVADWKFDPTEVESYEVELRTLRDAIDVVEVHAHPHDPTGE